MSCQIVGLEKQNPLKKKKKKKKKTSTTTTTTATTTTTPHLKHVVINGESKTAQHQIPPRLM